MPNAEAVGEFRQAVRNRLADLERSQEWLGKALGEYQERKPYPQSTVATWLRRSPPGPDVVFDIEDLLEVAPGAFSTHLGYLPLSAVGGRSVVDAIEADGLLSDVGRRALLAAYREFVKG